MFDLEEYIEVPYTYKSYFIDKYGSVVDSKKHIIKPEIIAGKAKVMINWYDGIEYYDLDLVICVSYFKIKIPFCLYNKIEVCFKDNNTTNLSTNNLYYKFKDGPLEVMGLEGLYYIPYYTNYALDKDFNLYRLSGKILPLKLSWDCNNYSGYCRSRKTIRDISTSKGVERHRAIGLVFIDYNNYPFNLQINHINGVKGDDRIENLEWVTPRENIMHACKNKLIEKYLGEVDAKYLADNKVLNFDSVNETSEKLNIHESLITEQLDCKELDFIPTKGYLFKKKENDWPTISENAVRVKNRKYSIKAINIFSGDVLIFKDVLQCSQVLKITTNAINKNYHTKSIIPVSEYIFRDIGFNRKYNYTKYHYEVFKNIKAGNRVMAHFAVNMSRKEVLFFVSLENLKTYFKLSNRQSDIVLKKGKIDNYKIIRFNYGKEYTTEELNKLLYG